MPLPRTRSVDYRRTLFINLIGGSSNCDKHSFSTWNSRSETFFFSPDITQNFDILNSFLMEIMNIGESEYLRNELWTEKTTF